MTLSSDMSIMKRVEILEEALAKALDRDESMNVAEDINGQQTVWVKTTSIDNGGCTGHDLYAIARDLERDIFNG